MGNWLGLDVTYRMCQSCQSFFQNVFLGVLGLPGEGGAEQIGSILGCYLYFKQSASALNFELLSKTWFAEEQRKVKKEGKGKKILLKRSLKACPTQLILQMGKQ